MKNAIQNVKESLKHVESAQNCINQALCTVEKHGNKELIEKVDTAVCNCVNQIRECVDNYTESPK